jgi:hypothetical protein
MMNRKTARLFLIVSGMISVPVAARAAIPAGYKGTPFDPAVAGGVGKIPASVKAGPYAIPGRLELENYDLGGDGVGYHTTEHYTDKNGDGYRIDRPTATMCMTDVSRNDVWYDTGMAALDGTMYPNATDHDFYIGSIHPGDWMNYTVDVKTAGTYSLSTTFSTGNGPPGLEGGDGSMEMKVSVNGTMQADWKAVFPNYMVSANYHNWKPYPNFATVTLEAGLQVIRIDLAYQHLNLDYIDFELMGADGGAADGGGSTGAAGASPTGTAGNSGTAGTSDTAGASGGGAAGSTSGGAAGSATGGGAAGVSGSGTGGAAGAATSGAGSGGSGTAGGSVGSTSGGGGSGAHPGAKSSSGCSLAVTPKNTGSAFASAVLLACALVARRRRR